MERGLHRHLLVASATREFSGVQFCDDSTQHPFDEALAPLPRPPAPPPPLPADPPPSPRPTPSYTHANTKEFKTSHPLISVNRLHPLGTTNTIRIHIAVNADTKFTNINRSLTPHPMNQRTFLDIDHLYTNTSSDEPGDLSGHRPST